MTCIWVTASQQISLYISAAQTVQESPVRHAKNMYFRSTPRHSGSVGQRQALEYVFLEKLH